MLTWGPLAKSTQNGPREATKPVDLSHFGVDFEHFGVDFGHFGVDFEHVGVDFWTPWLSQRRMGPARQRNLLTYAILVLTLSILVLTWAILVLTLSMSLIHISEPT